MAHNLSKFLRYKRSLSLVLLKSLIDRIDLTKSNVSLLGIMRFNAAFSDSATFVDDSKSVNI